MRKDASNAESAEVLNVGQMMRLEGRLVDQEFDGDRLAVRQKPLAVLQLATRVGQKLRRVAQPAPVLSGPSVTGGK